MRAGINGDIKRQVVRLQTRIGPEMRREIIVLLDAGEPIVAFELLVDVLGEVDTGLAAADRADLLALADELGSGRARQAVEFCRAASE